MSREALNFFPLDRNIVGLLQVSSVTASSRRRPEHPLRKNFGFINFFFFFRLGEASMIG